MSQSNKNSLNHFFKDKRYRAIETATSESEMRLKSFLIENAVYYFPLIASILGWYLYATMKNQFLPWGQTYSLFQIQGALCVSCGVILTFFAQSFIKPIVKNALDIHEKELTEDLYQKGAKFCTLDEFN